MYKNKAKKIELEEDYCSAIKHWTYGYTYKINIYTEYVQSPLF